MFTHPSYLSAHGVGDVVPICRTSGGELAFFADRGDHMAHLGRLERYREDEMHELAARAMNEHGRDIVLFEDVEVLSGGGGRLLPSLRFTYQGNWRIDLAAGVPGISASQRRNMRTKARKLAKLTGGEIRFEFTRSTDGNVERIVAFNREKLRLSGRRHRLTDDSLEALKSVTADIGYTSLLYSNEQLVAGDVVCVAGDRGYTVAGGYDVRYAKASPGIQIHRFTIAQLRSLGCREANLMWGDSPIKAQLGAQRQNLTTVAIARGHWTLVSPVFWRLCSGYGIAAAKEIAKRYVRRQPA